MRGSTTDAPARRAPASRSETMKLWFLLFQGLAVATCTAAPTTFKCANEEGRPIADLVVDLDMRTMRWAGFSCRIHSVTEEYVSAYQESTEVVVGGGLWVLNRMTGRFTRMDVYLLFDSPPKTKTHLTISTYRGT